MAFPSRLASQHALVTGGIDQLNILVNDAGITHVGSVLATTTEDVDRLYAVNVRGAYHTLHSGTPKLLARGDGAILNVARTWSQ